MALPAASRARRPAPQGRLPASGLSSGCMAGRRPQGRAPLPAHGPNSRVVETACADVDTTPQRRCPGARGLPWWTRRAPALRQSHRRCGDLCSAAQARGYSQASRTHAPGLLQPAVVCPPSARNGQEPLREAGKAGAPARRHRDPGRSATQGQLLWLLEAARSLRWARAPA